jgi:hypothetical protein
LFNIHIDGIRYGVYEPDATMLACSFDEVKWRIDNRGKHIAPFASEPDAKRIADAYVNAIYGEVQASDYFGIPLPDFCEMIYSSEIRWAPDGDEAFDDGSYVLQFDIKDTVRLIAFKRGDGASLFSLKDICLSADDFYKILQNWYDAFMTEWASSKKVTEGTWPPK